MPRTTTQTRKGRLEVVLPPELDAELDRRAREECLKRSTHVRRLIAKDAAAHPAVEHLPAAA